ncbi:MAG: phosphoglycerate dehydrogenase [Spirochaetales bacterium]|jgi:D-3-phosphoglycerate dehydrogenase|nr:phosphoglycerate dehydrogenase [Spirochaetales bacterium]
MYRIQTLNKISAKGLEVFPRDDYEIASEFSQPDAILVRSAAMHEMQMPPSLRVIARACAGTNNIPVERCTRAGIVVFNTPGANANSVKEMVIAGLLLSSRKICDGILWARGLAGRGEEIPALVEAEKSRFAGPELLGKTIGVIGLGAIGVLVANAVTSLGMRVIGYDPFISVESAWRLSREVERAQGLESLLKQCDYLTIHTPLLDRTRGLLNAERFGFMKPGMRVMNFARGGLVNNTDLIKALRSGQVARYVTDFPEEDLLREENVIAVPHLGASTPESEENCAVMAAGQIKTFLETGNIRHSVNFPDCVMERTSRRRIIIANRNIPNMVGQITTVLASGRINIDDLLNRHKDELAYNIIDIDNEVSGDLLEKLRGIEGVIMVREV